MRKKINFMLILLFSAMLQVSVVQAYNFSDMGNRELYEFRPSLKYANEDEKKAYWDEWDKRVRMMTAQEKEQYTDEDDPTSDKKIKFLYSPGMGYEGPISTPEDIYGSATRPVYKPLEERQIYGIPPKEEAKEVKESEPEAKSTENK